MRIRKSIMKVSGFHLSNINKIIRPFSVDKSTEEKGEAKDEDMLDKKISMSEIRQNYLNTIDEYRYKRLVEVEETIDLPYHLHGVQNKPEKKVVSSHML